MAHWIKPKLMRKFLAFVELLMMAKEHLSTKPIAAFFTLVRSVIGLIINAIFTYTLKCGIKSHDRLNYLAQWRKGHTKPKGRPLLWKK